MPKLSDKALRNVHKLIYLAKVYPDKTIRELSQLFAISVFEMNAAIWRARELEYLYVDGKTGFYKVEKEPASYDFGETVEELKDTLLYAFQQLAKDEQDLEENAFSMWGNGHAPHDLAIAMKQLMAEDKIATYTLTNITEPSKKGLKRGKKPIEDTYTFYTLKENVGKEYGRKQFKDQTRVK